MIWFGWFYGLSTILAYLNSNRLYTLLIKYISDDQIFKITFKKTGRIFCFLAFLFKMNNFVYY